MPVYRTVSAWLSRQRQAREKDSVTLRDRELALRSTTRYHTIPPPIPPVPRAFHPALLEPFAYTTEGTPAPSTSTTRAFTPISSAPTTTGESSPATASNPLTLGSTLPISLGTTSQYEWGAYVRGALAEKTATRGVRRAAASSQSASVAHIYAAPSHPSHLHRRPVEPPVRMYVAKRMRSRRAEGGCIKESVLEDVKRKALGTYALAADQSPSTAAPSSSPTPGRLRQPSHRAQPEDSILAPTEMPINGVPADTGMTAEISTPPATSEITQIHPLPLRRRTGARALARRFRAWEQGLPSTSTGDNVKFRRYLLARGNLPAYLQTLRASRARESLPGSGNRIADGASLAADPGYNPTTSLAPDPDLARAAAYPDVLAQGMERADLRTEAFWTAYYEDYWDAQRGRVAGTRRTGIADPSSGADAQPSTAAAARTSTPQCRRRLLPTWEDEVAAGERAIKEEEKLAARKRRRTERWASMSSRQPAHASTRGYRSMQFSTGGVRTLTRTTQSGREPARSDLRGKQQTRTRVGLRPDAARAMGHRGAQPES
ncbi:hypothetical protein BD626DRAFT_165666 [Schizophyllum amplum]|uniref:Uncharacterized protein n=1 Tax=Schizophyllum amplum TaxID=97359 RepID=A0A550CPY8_9AGAR|nr:hypothetical protein BD626DRAFT_165666 [Auriculariopsis ampla]